VLSAIAIVPSAPVMVPELASSAAVELADLRAAVLTAAQSLPARWIAIGVGPADEVIGPQRAGTFAGYGVDLPVALAPGAWASARRPGDDAGELPLCALVTGWLRGEANPQARAEVRVFSDDLGGDIALAHGRRLRTEVDEAGEAIGVLVVADGFHTLTPPAPGGYLPASVPMQADLDVALATGDTAALERLPRAVVGRVAYQVLAGLVGLAGKLRSTKELYRGAPYGVGYFTGVWHP
jgi:hypothetical protein